MKCFTAIAPAFLLSTVAATGWAQPAEYPHKSILFMVPQAAGGSTDTLARLIGQRLGDGLGVTVVIENRPGANGIIGTEAALKAAPNGATLVVSGTGIMAINPSLYPKLSYDPVRDLQPISMVAQGVTAVVVHTSVPATSIKDLVAWAKQKGPIAYGSAGNGSISHLSGELFRKVVGIELEHIPYKSAGAALTALISGEVQLSFLSPVTVAGQLKAGGAAKMRPLAVSSPKRFIGAPDIPGSAEAGFPQFEARLWFGLFTAAKTPKPVVDRLNQAIVEILAMPEVRDTILKQGIEVVSSTPAELGRFVNDELARWTPIIKAAGITAN